MALDAGTIVGSYRVEKVLGRGGMATVYGASHVGMARDVALKVLAVELSSDREFVERFRREGWLQASLEHPHVVRVYEAGESEFGLYLAMRLVEGPTLAALSAQRALDVARALSLLDQVADALDAAHAAGLVHRDVKSQNVLVGDAGDAYLGDFGLTRLGGSSGLTATGKLLGTLAYLAPEVIRGAEPDPAADRYAFAAMAFECLTGTVPYPRRSEAAVLYAHTNEPAPRISARRGDLPASLDPQFVKALGKEPADRPASARELVAAIAATLQAAGASGLGPPPPSSLAAIEETTVRPFDGDRPAPERPVVARRGGALRLGAAALAGAAIAAGIALLAGRADEPKASPVLSPLHGAHVLGSDLAEGGRTLDCRGRPPRTSSSACSIVQAALPGRTLVVPRDGVVRRWAVRSARGELVLAVLRPRGGGAFQVARSPNEFVSDGGVHVFDTNLAVERGDVLGLTLLPGSGVGAREATGATTQRWIPRLGPERRAELPPGTGFDRELLLRVEYVPGAEQRLPSQIVGAAARKLPSGRVRRRSRMRFASGRRVDIAFVAIGQRIVLDQFMAGRRTARIEVPGFRPGNGRILTFETYVEESEPEQIGVYLEYVNEESARVQAHFYAAIPRRFNFVN
jgi:hypothetical protein